MELRAALKLAPHLVTVHWRLANLLLREEKLDQAGAEFRLASEADPELLTPTLNLCGRRQTGRLKPQRRSQRRPRTATGARAILG